MNRSTGVKSSASLMLGILLLAGMQGCGAPDCGAELDKIIEEATAATGVEFPEGEAFTGDMDEYVGFLRARRSSVHEQCMADFDTYVDVMNTLSDVQDEFDRMDWADEQEDEAVVERVEWEQVDELKWHFKQQDKRIDAIKSGCPLRSLEQASACDFERQFDEIVGEMADGPEFRRLPSSRQLREEIRGLFDSDRNWEAEYDARFTISGEDYDRISGYGELTRPIDILHRKYSKYFNKLHNDGDEMPVFVNARDVQLPEIEQRIDELESQQKAFLAEYWQFVEETRAEAHQLVEQHKEAAVADAARVAAEQEGQQAIAKEQAASRKRAANDKIEQFRQDGFRGISWGSLLAEHRDEFTPSGKEERLHVPNVGFIEIPVSYYDRSSDKLSIGDVALRSISYGYSDDRLINAIIIASEDCTVVNIPCDSPKMLLDALKAKYGEPKLSSADGFMWAEDDEWLVVLYATLVNQPAIMILNTRDVLEIDRRIKAQKSEAAKKAAEDF